ncbi:hypothetical protein HDU67_007887 [Dinochytrium kinnereticum]|nr:hypothetical protein HDU67_007887 [Dinochytrium kinnereticum]
MLSVIFPSNLFYISTHSVVQTSVSILFGSVIGTILERTPRLGAIWLSIFLQKIGIAGASMSLWAVERWFMNDGSGVIWGLFSVAVVFSSVMRLANMGATIAVERDWVVVIAGGDSAVLTVLNTHFRRLDLICKLVAPLIVSLVSAYIGVPTTMLAVAGWCMASMPLELYLVTHVYKLVPMLSVPRTPPVDLPPDQGSSETVVEGSVDEGGVVREAKPSKMSAIGRSFMAWKLFAKHPVFLASIALSCLYFTSLGFSGVMITYLLDKGYTPTLLALMRGLSVVFGLSATITLPKLVSSIGLVRSGLWGVWMEFGALLPLLVAVFMIQWTGEVTVGVSVALFGGAVVSRWGLWSFDLVETQLLQESVSPEDVGIINGVQFSLQNLFELLSYIVTMIWYLPSQFYISAALSTGGVFVACITYTLYAKKMRGHLFHFDKLARWGVAVFGKRRGAMANDGGAMPIATGLSANTVP